MKTFFKIAIVSSMLCASIPAVAADIHAVPAAYDGQSVRYHKGIPTVEDDLAVGAIKVAPTEDLDHGSMQFMIAILNKGNVPFNFGVENIRAFHNGKPIKVFTREELEKRAKNRAMWSQIGYAALAGVAAAAQNNNTTITSHGRYGTQHTVIRHPGLSNGQIAAVAAGGGAIALSQVALQRTLDQLSDEIIQTSTLDPETSYGGRIIIDKLKGMKNGDVVRLVMDTGPEQHSFDFTVSK